MRLYSPLLPLLGILIACPLAAQPAPKLPPVQTASGRGWSGRWIWTTGDAAPKNSYVYFRKSLELGGVPKRPQIHLTADSRYQLFVNGAFVGRGPVRSDRRWLYYDTWDLTGRLKKGQNQVTVLVHHYGEYTFQYMLGRGGLLADLTDGTRVLARTDATWRAMRSRAWATGQPRMSIQNGFNEVFDAREAPEGWKGAGFNDRSWPAAVELGRAGMEPWPNLVPRDIPPMLEEIRYPGTVIQTAEIESAPSQYVNLLELMEPKTHGVAYLATLLTSPEPRPVTLHIGSDDALKVWLNGKLVCENLTDRGAQPDQETIPVTLLAGVNTLLVKVIQGSSLWEFYCRLSGAVDGVNQSGPLGGGANWAVAGPFVYPAAEGIPGGFRRPFPPEATLDWKAEYTNAAGRSFGWRAVKAGVSGAARDVAAEMNLGSPRPILACEVRGSDRLTRADVAGTRVRTVGTHRVSFLIDLGQETTGYPQITIRGAAGGEIIDLGYGEVLQTADGKFVAQNAPPPLVADVNGVAPQQNGTAPAARLNPDRDGVHYADRYICRPGDQVFETFDKRAGRYWLLEVRNAPAGLEIGRVCLRFSTYPVVYRGSFQCSDERLNKIWEIGRWTCQLNMEDGYTDCPWRERGQWWGDARVEALINYYCFGDTKLIAKALRQMAQSLNEEGMTWGVYPTDWDGGRLPSFTLIWISQIWETYLHLGDAALVKELLPRARYSLDRFFAPRVGPRGLLKDIPYWVFIDWAPVDDKGESGALNAYYYDALRATARMATLVGDTAAAQDYEKRAEAVRTALNTHLWDAQQHAYRDSLTPDGKLSTKVSQQTNSLCVLFDIAPAAEREKILEAIYGPASRGKVVEAGSPYFSYYQLAALFHAGRYDQAMTYIRERWGRMLDWGATTWWEMWNPGASFCHGWSGGPTYNLPAEALGVKPYKPGFEEVEVAPHLFDLKYATGVVPTVKGDVMVAWQRDATGKLIALRVDRPDTVPAIITLPLPSPTATIKVNKRPELPQGVEKLASPPGVARYRVTRKGAVLFEARG